jgi:hypothetical protein
MFGEVAERLKAHDWKSCVPQKGTEGSNPSLSAMIQGAVSRLLAKPIMIP